MSTYRISSEIFDEGSKMLMSEIKQNINPVAVHVRRGDLSVEVRAYGKPASLSYFKRAVDYMEKETVTPFFTSSQMSRNGWHQNLFPILNLQMRIIRWWI